MIFNGPVPPENQKKSQHYYKLFLTFNGFAYMCLGETVIILIALQLGCSDGIVAALGAMVYFGFLLLPLGKYVASKVGAARSQSIFWVARNLAGVMVALSVPVSLYGNQLTAVAMLLTGGFFFYGFRAAGVILSQPLLGEITAPAERSKFIAATQSIGFGSSCMALLLIGIICQFTHNVWVLMCIALFGSSLGITSSQYIRKIDESSMLRESASRPVFKEIGKALRESSIRKQVAATFVINIANIMLIPVSLIAIKRGFGISNANAVFFSLFQWVFSIIGSWVATRLARKMGPRRVAIVGYLLISTIAPLWFVLSGAFGSVWRIFLLTPFLIGGLSFAMMSNSMIHYFLQNVDEDKRVVVSLLISTASGVGAGLTGLAITGALLTWLERSYTGAPFPETYRIYFLLAGIILLPGILLLSALRPLPVEKRMIRKTWLDFLW